MLLVQAGALKNRFSFNTEIYDDFFFYFDKLENIAFNNSFTLSFTEFDFIKLN